MTLLRPSLLILLFVACASTTETAASLVRVITASASACPQGGTVVEAGIDTNHDGVLDDAEVTSSQTVCNGSSAAQPTISTEPPGEHCAAGGVKVQVGEGTPSYVCNGATGATGATGDPGATGAAGSSVQVSAEPAGSNCPTGGLKVQSGTGQPSYVCNGRDGQSVTLSSEPPGANCPFGGTRLQVGTGAPTYVCIGFCSGPGAVGPSNLTPTANQSLVGHTAKQTFTAPATGSLASIELSLLSCESMGTFSLAVYDGTSLLATASAGVSGLSCGSAIIPLQAGQVTGVLFPIDACVPLTGGHQYAFTITTTGLAVPLCNQVSHLCTAGGRGGPCMTNDDCVIDLRAEASSDTYAGGQEFVDEVPASADLVFKIFVR